MKIFLVLSLALLSVYSSQNIIYVNQSAEPNSNFADGSQMSPFPSLRLAFLSINSTTEIIFMGQSYSVEQNESYIPSDQITTQIVISFSAMIPSFVLNFSTNGLISCVAGNQNRIIIKVTGINIEAEGQISSSNLFEGTCEFAFQDIYIEKLVTNFLNINPGTNVQFKNFTIDDTLSNLILMNNQNISESKGTANFDSVILKSKFLRQGVGVIQLGNYSLVKLANSLIEGCGIFVFGDNFNMTNSLMKNGYIQMDSITKFEIENSGLANSTISVSYEIQSIQVPDSLLAIFNNFTLENTTQSLNGIILLTGKNLTNLDILIENSNFYNNNLLNDEDILRLYQFNNASVTIFDSRFISNTAVKGSVIEFEMINTIASINLKNNTFQMNSALNGGVFSFQSLGKFQSSKTHMNIADSKFLSNHAENEGGIVYVKEGNSDLSINLENNIFDSNSAYNGGVFSLEAQNQIDITFNNETYTNNTATGDGGVVIISRKELKASAKANLSIFNSTFVSNVVQKRGGVFSFQEGSTINLSSEKNSFVLNSASQGGVFLFEASFDIQVVIENDIYAKNKATDVDPVMCIKNFRAMTTVGIYNSSFTSNIAEAKGSDRGGLIQLQAITLDQNAQLMLILNLENNLFSSNYYRSGILAVLVDCLTQMTSRNNTFMNNVASIGGIFYFRAYYYFTYGREMANISIEHSNFISNTVTGEGGVIYSFIKTMSVFMESNFFDSNSALKGGIVFHESNKFEHAIKNDIYTNNKAMSGAVIYVKVSKPGSSLNIINSRFISNIAKQSGGVFACDASNNQLTINLENNLFQLNSAISGGVFCIGSENDLEDGILFNIKNDTYINNKAYNGGVISIENLLSIPINISIANFNFSSNIATNTGGVFYIEEGKAMLFLTSEANYYGSNSAITGGVFFLKPIAQSAMIIKNDYYIKNTATNEGAVLAAQGSENTGSIFNFDIVIMASKFIFNQAIRSGGTFILYQLKTSNLTVVDSEFYSNVAASRGGGVMHLEKSEVGTIIRFENCTFENNSAVTGGVIHFEYINQGLISLKNNSYGYNNALQGAVIALHSSSQQMINSDLKALIEDSKFYNNKASDNGGALAFVTIEISTITVANSDFKSNYATDGGVVYMERVSKGNITFKNNIFGLNSGYRGGVLNFKSISNSPVYLEKNEYFYNTATFGGIGYVTESATNIKDIGSIARANSAKIEGGAWSISSKSFIFSFENMTFLDNNAQSKGGCLYYSDALMKFDNVIFQNCSTYRQGSLGGALFITKASLTQANNLVFINNQAEYGAIINFQNIKTGQKHSFSNINFISELKSTAQNQIQSNKGGDIAFKNIVIPSLNSPFFSLKENPLEIENMTISNIKCRGENSSFAFCLFSLDSSINITINKLSAQNISSSVPLIISRNSSVSLNQVNATNIQSTSGISVAWFQSSQVKIDEAYLANISSKFIQAESNSVLNISNSNFDNQAKKSDSIGTPSQFIVLSESSIQLNSTTFNFNSPSFPQKGGAVQLINTRAFILGYVNFTENRANNGGAIFIQGEILEGIISNCIFSNNLVPNDINGDPGFGGAIYFENLNSILSSRLMQQQSRLRIENSIFKENIAFTGGAVYSKEVSFLVLNSTFEYNQAISGGGLAININNPSLLIDILQSKFQHNIASLYGASILQLKRDVINDKTGTTIINETQKFTTGFPAKLKIRAFSLIKSGDSFNNIINVTSVNELENNKYITLESEASLNSSFKLMNIKSGEAFNRLIEISVLDEKDNHLTELTSNDGQVSLKISNVTYPPDSTNNFSYIVGNVRKPLMNGSAVFLQETNLFAFPRSLFDIEASVSITHRNLGNIDYLLSKTFQIQLSECAIGQIFIKETLICDTCKSGYFSLGDPFLTAFCQKCDTTKADCPGGSIIYPKPGYWRLGEFSDNLITCSVPGACLGGKVKKEDFEAFSLTGFCNEIEGYEGNACAKCKPGFAKFGRNNQCTQCTDNAGYYLKFFGLLTIQILVIVFNIYSNLKNPDAISDPEEEKTKGILTIVQGTVIKVVVDYIQIFGIVSSIEIDWPEIFKIFESIFSKSVPSSKDVFTVDCFFSLAQGSSENIVFHKLLILNIQPFVCSLFGLLFWICVVKLIKRQSITNNSQFKSNLLLTNCLIAYLLQPEIVKSTLQLFKCQNLGSAANPQNFLKEDLEIKCGEPTHLAWALGLGVPVMLFWLGVPIIIFITIILRNNRFNDEKTLERYHFVFRRYKKNRIYWDLIILIRKTALIFIVVFFNNLYSQVFFSLFVCASSLHLHYTKKPYMEDVDVSGYPKLNVNLNNLETLSLISNCLLLYGGLYFIKNKEFGVTHGVLMAAIFSMNALLLVRVAKALYWVFSIKAKMLLKNKKQKKIVVSIENKTEEESPKLDNQIIITNEENIKETATPDKVKQDIPLQEESLKLLKLQSVGN